MENRIVLSLDHGPGNPRNSEGAMVTLADGRVLFAYTHYTGDDWSDHAAACIAARTSSDGGRTWTPTDRILVANEGRQNVMSVSLLRLADGRVALFYLRKNGMEDCRLWWRVSRDEGDTWSDPALCIPAPGYFVVNNDRVVQLRSGRLIVPAAYHRARLIGDESTPGAFDGRALAVFYLSDDAGSTWRESDDWWALPVKSASGLQEPGVVELADGTLYAWCRTTTGRQWELRSADQGATWTAPQPSPFYSPCSPMSIKRLPTGGALLAVWNDHRQVTTAPPASSWGRTPLTAALSRDEGASWSAPRQLEDDPERGYCYTAIHPVEDAVLLAYCCGGRGGGVLQDACVRRVGLEWFDAAI